VPVDSADSAYRWQAGLTVVAALNDMLRDASKAATGKARHEGLPV
jgi:hypothetical protein